MKTNHSTTSKTTRRTAALVEVARLMKAADHAGYADYNDVRVQDHHVCLDVRDWGDWEVPADAHDDGQGDYDWQVMTAATRAHPTVKLTYAASEKNWLCVMAA
jgi:hypothetical protein